MELTEGIKVPLDDLEDERDRVWEKNHKKITECIRDALRVKKGMPSISYIVQGTGLNRKTVRKHVQEFSTTHAFKEHSGKYKLMVGEIMDTLCSLALSNNIKAARLYMELMGMLKTSQVVNHNFINKQTNYVQVNGIEITEEIIKALSPEELKQIEHILVAGRQLQPAKNEHEMVVIHGQKSDGQNK
jgi:hypothetical protein